jgi:diguanylate cyclase (GGDEF)-like protein
MKTDPRLAEINFLARLDSRNGSTVLSVSDSHAACDLSPHEFKDLLFGLLAEACVVMGSPLQNSLGNGDSPQEDPRLRIWRVNAPAYRTLHTDQALALYITHFGRLRLWRLRDELNRTRIRDSFGILVDGRHFDDDLRVAFWMSPGRPVGVLMADLDHFKAVNDTLDHLRGDEAMRRYLEIIRGVASAHGGEAYRKGGDETLAILPGRNLKELGEVAEVLRVAVEAEFKTFDAALAKPPTSSIGACSFLKGERPEDVRRKVDHLLMAAKREGRNRVKAE